MLLRMDSNSLNATHRREYIRAQMQHDRLQPELNGLSSYPQPPYASGEFSDSAPNPWMPSAWPDNHFSTPSTSSQPHCASLSQPQNVFDVGFQQATPWPSFPNVTSAASTNSTLPFPPSTSTFIDRESPTMLSPIASGPSSTSSRTFDRNFVESNDDEEEDQYDTIMVKSKFTSPKAKALHKVAWTTSSSKQKPESRSRPKGRAKRSKRSAKASRTPHKPATTERSHSSKSNSDSGNHLPSKGRANHDLTEKRYRSRLNNQFENLLAALPASLIAENEGSIGGVDDRREKRISKADVLSLARGHIESLERKGLELEASNQKLERKLKEYQDEWRAMGGRMLP